ALLDPNPLEDRLSIPRAGRRRERADRPNRRRRRRRRAATAATRSRIPARRQIRADTARGRAEPPHRLGSLEALRTACYIAKKKGHGRFTADHDDHGHLRIWQVE